MPLYVSGLSHFLHTSPQLARPKQLNSCAVLPSESEMSSSLALGRREATRQLRPRARCSFNHYLEPNISSFCPVLQLYSNKQSCAAILCKFTFKTRCPTIFADFSSAEAVLETSFLDRHSSVRCPIFRTAKLCVLKK